ncbi:MAG: branched-chain amino acid ABC transporter permease [Thermoleophilia bacterium]|nr:branched-chain amino acid ABC transporter permease [Thermoleophilia bacterium]
MQLFFQQIVDGLTAGSVYAALALALVLVYRGTGIVNFGQGEMGTLSTYFAWQLTAWGIPVWAAVGAAMATAFLGACVVFLALILPLSRRPLLTVVTATLGLMLACNSVALWVWGALPQSFPSLFPDRVWAVAGVRFTATAVGNLGALLCVAALLFVLFERTKIGLGLRGATSNPESASLVGLRVRQMHMLGWGLAAAVGALAGALVAPKLFLTPDMMLAVLLYGVAAAVLGGFDSPVGAIAGGLLIGVVESLVGTYVDPIGAELKVAVALVVIFVFLLVRPQGLLGRRKVVKV